MQHIAVPQSQKCLTIVWTSQDPPQHLRVARENEEVGFSLMTKAPLPKENFKNQSDNTKLQYKDRLHNVAVRLRSVSWRKQIMWLTDLRTQPSHSPTHFKHIGFFILTSEARGDCTVSLFVSQSVCHISYLSFLRVKFGRNLLFEEPQIMYDIGFNILLQLFPQIILTL